MSPPLAVFSAPISQGALSMAGFAEALALIDVGVLGGVGMARGSTSSPRSARR